MSIVKLLYNNNKNKSLQLKIKINVKLISMIVLSNFYIDTYI